MALDGKVVASDVLRRRELSADLTVLMIHLTALLKFSHWKLKKMMTIFTREENSIVTLYGLMTA